MKVEQSQDGLFHEKENGEMELTNRGQWNAKDGGDHRVATTKKPVMTLLHDHSVDLLCVSQYGRFVVTVSQDGVRLWDLSIAADTQQMCVSILQIDKTIREVKFAMIVVKGTTPKLLIIMTSDENDTWVWDVTEHHRGPLTITSQKTVVASTDQCLMLPSVACVQFFHGTHRLVMASISGAIRSCDIAWDNSNAMYGCNQQGMISDHGHFRLRLMNISPDNRFILTSDSSGRIKLWDAEALMCIQTIETSSETVSYLWSQDDCIMTYANGLIETREAPSLRRLDAVTPQHKIHSLSGVTRDGSVLLTTGRNEDHEYSTTTAHLWDTFTGQLLHTFKTRTGYKRSSSHLASMSMDGSIVATSGDENEILIWNMSIGECQYTLRTQENIKTIAMAADGSHILSGDHDGVARVWSIAQFYDVTGTTNQQPILKLEEGQQHDQTVTMIAVSIDGSLIATAGEKETTAKIWDGHTGRFLRTLSPIHSTSSLLAMAMYNTSLMATAYIDSTARIWNPSIGEPLFYLTGHHGPVSCVGFSNDGLRVVLGSYDSTASLWGTNTGDCITTFEGHEGSINAAAITAFQKNDLASQPVVTGSDDGTVRMWDADSGFCEHILSGHESGVTMLSVSKEIDRIVTAARADKKINVWDGSGNLLLTIPTPTTISSLDVSFDGMSVVAVADDNMILMWLLHGMVTKSWGRYENALPVSPLTINDRFLAGYDDAMHQDLEEYQWDWFEEAVDHNLSLALMMDLSYFDRSDVTIQERRTLMKPDAATFENPFLLAIRHGNAASGYLRRMLRVVPHEGVRKRRNRYSDEDSNTLPTSMQTTDHTSLPPFWDHYSSLGSLAKKPDLLDRISWTGKEARLPTVTRGEKVNLLMQALYHGNEACLDTILELYIELLTPPMGKRSFIPRTNDKLAFRVFKGNNVPLATKHGRHVADEIDMMDLCLVALDHPSRFLDFVGRLKSVPQYDEANRDLPRLKLRQAGPIYLMAGSEERLPLPVHGSSFWRCVEQQGELERSGTVAKIWGALELVLGVRETVALSVSPGIIPIKNIVGLEDDDTPSPFLKTVVQAAVDVGDISAFSNEVVQKVVEFKWETYVKRYYLTDALLFTALYVLFITESLAFAQFRNSQQEERVVGLTLWSLLALLLAYFINIEVVQIYKCMKTGFADYFLDGWNIVDIATVAMVTATLGVRLAIYIVGAFRDREIELSHQFSAVSMPFLAFQALFFLRGFQESGAIIRMTIRITRAIMMFSFILFVFIASNAAGFMLIFPTYLLRPTGLLPSMDFTTFDQSLLTVFGMLFGQFNQADLSLAISPPIATVLLVMFLFLTGIVLLNLLIAIMGDKYSEVQSNAVAEATFSRAQLILEYEDRISSKKKRAKQKEWFPTWLQILRKGSAYENKMAATSNGGSDPLPAWLEGGGGDAAQVGGGENRFGDLVSLKRALEGDLAHVQSELQAELHEMKSKVQIDLDSIREDLKHLTHAINESMLRKQSLASDNSTSMGFGSTRSLRSVPEAINESTETSGIDQDVDASRQSRRASAGLDLQPRNPRQDMESSLHDSLRGPSARRNYLAKGSQFSRHRFIGFDVEQPEKQSA